MAASGQSREDRWSLAGKTALVTGGSKGIGRAIVEELAGFGVKVHTCARNDADLQECLRRWRADHRLAPVTASVCDVSARGDRERLVAAARDEFGGRLDILVNNAGQTFFGAAADCTAEDYARLMATNLESGFHLAQLAHPLLVASGSGGGSSVVNVSSIAGLISFPALSVYSATKGAMNHPQPRRRVGAGQGARQLRRARGRPHRHRRQQRPKAGPGALPSPRRSRPWSPSSACRPRPTSRARSSASTEVAPQPRPR